MIIVIFMFFYLVNYSKTLSFFFLFGNIQLSLEISQSLVLKKLDIQGIYYKYKILYVLKKFKCHSIIVKTEKGKH